MPQIAAFWRKRGKFVLVLLAVLSLVGAGAYGQLSYSGDVEQYLPQVLPEAASIGLMYNKPGENSSMYAGFNTKDEATGYVTVTKADGYGGPMTVMLGWSLEGTILTLEVVEHYEDEPWFQPLYDLGFINQYIGRHYSEPLKLYDDVDVVSGSTYSYSAVALGVQHGREMVAAQLGRVPYTVEQPVVFGLAEILLLVGLGSVVTLRLVPRLRKFGWARYLTLAFGLAVLGIWLAAPLSLVNFAIWTVGFTPSWQSHLFLYILVFGVLALAVAFAKNFYCFWLCPFVAVQEGIHFIGGGRVHPTAGWHRALRNTRYLLLWLALLLALLLRAPPVVTFEPWHTLFGLKGSAGEWLLVGVTLFLALVVYDFWCQYLCPVGAVMDITLRLRRWFRTLLLRRVGSNLEKDFLRNILIIFLVLAVAIISLMLVISNLT